MSLPYPKSMLTSQRWLLSSETQRSIACHLWCRGTRYTWTLFSSCISYFGISSICSYRWLRTEGGNCFPFLHPGLGFVFFFLLLDLESFMGLGLFDDPRQIFLSNTFFHLIHSSLIMPGSWCWIPIPFEAWVISDFLTIFFFKEGFSTPRPTPNPGGSGLCIYIPPRQRGPVIPPGIKYPF